MCAKPTRSLAPETRNIARLRILATTDLHGHLLPHDYITDRPTQGGGLAGLARLINEARAQAQADDTPTLLFDNGDTFQGTPLASHLAQQEVDRNHPIIAALNLLKYDALGLGNHDLDHGLTYLKSVASALDMPILNSNLRDVDLRPLRDSLLIQVPVGTDALAPLTVGVLSVLPMQSAAWNSDHLGAQASIQIPAECIADRADSLRAAGADLVVTLAHMGVGHQDRSDSDGQAAQALATGGHIDALILGHTHRHLPAPDYAEREGVDIHNSTLSGVPAVMAGHAGSNLAVMDLDLKYDLSRGWQVVGHNCALRPNGANVIPDPAISALAAPQHAAVRGGLRAPVATATQDMHSYFSLAAPARTQYLTARAHYLIAQKSLTGRPEAAQPLLAAAAAHGAGGRDGLGNYLCIPEGPVLRRHIAGLVPFANRVVVVSMSAIELHQWLEHGALVFNKLAPDTPHQMLVNEEIPAFQFDTIYGLEYTINPAAPPLKRISDMTYQGAPLDPDQVFNLATTRFRIAGGGGYTPIPDARIVTTSRMSLHEAMLEVLATPEADPWKGQIPWRFQSLENTSAILLTHPDALDCLAGIAHLRPRLLGSTPDGFIKLSITL
ncbi:5'-nucleotidase C-terminal domain-containing protein [uncultured Sulfitobacter sp.]|uniref:bifunctional metallophosphatase/5'-nucleotidase n=1 Tax=uncultured Sulfitobacter sp. TaxID=191468 RepID=UPI0026090E44|nr:5'-nucleotidase C-terminal domain-containing protein [uncultured Sulfitobacter sp.]